MITETAVRYRGHTDTEVTVEPVGTVDALREAIRDLLSRGIVGTVVVREVADWQPATDQAALRQVARERVEITLWNYTQGNLGDDEDPLNGIAFLTPHLKDKPSDPARTDVHLTRAYWWDELTGADDRATKLRDGFLDPSQYDEDAEDARRDYARDVLAGVIVPGHHAKTSA